MVMEYQRKESSTLKLLNENLREVKSSISNILKAIEKGIFTDSTKERLDELEEQRKELEGQISKEKIEHPLLEPDYIRYWFHRFRKMDSTLLKNRQKLVDCFVNSIVLYDDRVEFFFNFRKGANILSLEELEKGSCLFDTLPPDQGIYELYVP